MTNTDLIKKTEQWLDWAGVPAQPITARELVRELLAALRVKAVR